MAEKRLISIGEAWVDPSMVIAIDSMFDDDSPDWGNCRVELVSGSFILGTRAPERVARAVRYPDADDYDEVNAQEADGKAPADPATRAKRRAQATSGHAPPASLRAVRTPPGQEEPRGS